MYQKLEFGSDAKAFIRLRMSQGPGLANLLLRLPIENGRVVAFLPPMVDFWHLKHFLWPIHSVEGVSQDDIDWDYREREYDLVHDFLSDREDAIAIFYTATFPPGREPLRVVHPRVENWVHHVVHRKADAELIA